MKELTRTLLYSEYYLSWNRVEKFILGYPKRGFKQYKKCAAENFILRELSVLKFYAHVLTTASVLPKSRAFNSHNTKFSAAHFSTA